VPGGSFDPKGYYQELSISMDATQSEVAKAYRRRALAMHPDKGGSAEGFRRVADAYHILGDIEERRKYDASSSAPPAAAAPQQAPPREQSDETPVGVAFSAIITAPPRSRTTLISCMSLDVLQGLATVLKPNARNKKTGSGQACSELAIPSSRESFKTKGLHRQHNNWWVQVAWHSFKVAPSENVVDLDVALSLHTALCEARNSAKERQRITQERLHMVDPALCKRVSVGEDENEECPLLEHELAAVYAAAPGLVLHFTTDFSTKPRVECPWVPDLQLALQFRAMTRKVRRQCPHRVPELKAMMSDVASISRQSAKAISAHLLQLVQQQVQKLLQSQPNAQHRGEAPAMGAPAPTAALRNTSEAEYVRKNEEQKAKIRQYWASLATSISKNAKLQGDVAERERQIATLKDTIAKKDELLQICNEAQPTRGHGSSSSSNSNSNRNSRSTQCSITGRSSNVNSTQGFRPAFKVRPDTSSELKRKAMSLDLLRANNRGSPNEAMIEQLRRKQRMARGEDWLTETRSADAYLRR